MCILRLYNIINSDNIGVESKFHRYGALCTLYTALYLNKYLYTHIKHLPIFRGAYNKPKYI